MATKTTDQELFSEFDTLLLSLSNYTFQPKAAKVPNYNEPDVSIVDTLKPAVEYKIAKAGLLLFSYYKETHKLYLKRCESAVESLKAELKALMGQASVSRRNYKSVLSKKLKSTRSVLVRCYKDVIPEATSLVNFTQRDHVYVMEFEAEVFEHETLLFAMHALANVVRLLRRLFAIEHTHTDTGRMLKKRLHDIKLLKRFVIGPLGLDESAFMQFMSFLLLNVHNWYKYLSQQVTAYEMRIDPVNMLDFVFKPSSHRASVFFNTSARMQFANIDEDVQETANGFTIVGDSYEDAAIEFLDYN